MARKGRVDRGLVLRIDAAGEKVWYVRLYHLGKEEWFGGFDKKTDARNFYDEKKADQRNARFFPERHQSRSADTVASIIDRYTATLPGSGKAANTIKDELRYAVWWKNRLVGVRLNTLTTDMIEQVKRDLTLAGLSAQTLVHYCKFLRHALYATIGKSKLINNPFGEGENKVKLKRVKPGKTRFLSPAEEALLCQHIGGAYAPWVRLAILTGLRRHEQFSLRWSNVDLEHGQLTLPSTKAGEVQYVMLTDEGRAILRAMLTAHMDKGRIGDYVFPSPGNSTRHLDEDNFYGRVFLPAVRSAKLEGVTWHTLRHTFASRLAMSGQGDQTISILLRHSTTGLVKRYAHLSPSHLKAALESVETFGRDSRTVIKPEMERGETLK